MAACADISLLPLPPHALVQAPTHMAGRPPRAVLAAVRPGYEVGYKLDDKYYVNNHLMFKVLVHETNGQYTLSQQSEAELEAAAAVEVRCGLLCVAYNVARVGREEPRLALSAGCCNAMLAEYAGGVIGFG